MHERLAVYVPNDAATELLSATVAHIIRGSGIVGVEVPTDDEPRVQIYYEGNRYGSQNIVTFADRCYFAASRLTERYPTVAQAYVRADAVKQAGWFYVREKRVEIRDVQDMIALAHWLEIPVGDDRMHRELRPEGVRA